MLPMPQLLKCELRDADGTQHRDFGFGLGLQRHADVLQYTALGPVHNRLLRISTGLPSLRQENDEVL